MAGTVEFKNELGVLLRTKENNLCYFFESEETRWEPIDTRTDEEKLRDAMASELTPGRDMIKSLLASNKFTITLNK